MSAHDDTIDADPYGLLPALQAGQVRVLRQSTLGTADTCLKRLEYDLDPSIPYGTGEGRAVGTAYHAALERYYRHRKAFGAVVPTPEFIDEVVQVAFDSFDLERESAGDRWVEIEGRETALGKIEHMVRAYFTGEHYWPDGYEVLGVEHTFLMPLRDGWIVKGTVDLILRQVETGWLIIVDHKTAKRPWKRGKESHRSTNQPAWYVHFVGQLYETPAVTMVFDVITHAGQFERRPAPVEPQHIVGVFAKADSVTALIEQGGPYPPNVGSFLCDARWCDFWLTCPWGEAFDRQGVVSGSAVSISS